MDRIKVYLVTRAFILHRYLRFTMGSLAILYTIVIVWAKKGTQAKGCRLKDQKNRVPYAHTHADMEYWCATFLAPISGHWPFSISLSLTCVHEFLRKQTETTLASQPSLAQATLRSLAIINNICVVFFSFRAFCAWAQLIQTLRKTFYLYTCKTYYT